MNKVQEQHRGDGFFLFSKIAQFNVEVASVRIV